MINVYAIKSLKRDYIYVGMTKDLSARIKRHDRGYERTTKPYRPFKLIYREKFPDRKEARKKEKYLKSGIGKEYLKTL